MSVSDEVEWMLIADFVDAAPRLASSSISVDGPSCSFSPETAHLSRRLTSTLLARQTTGMVFPTSKVHEGVDQRGFI